MNAIHNFCWTSEEVVDLAIRKAEVLWNTVFISTRQRLFLILEGLTVSFEPAKKATLKAEALQTPDNFELMSVLKKAWYNPTDSW
jgi:hypothetical protein